MPVCGHVHLSVRAPQGLKYQMSWGWRYSWLPAAHGGCWGSNSGPPDKQAAQALNVWAILLVPAACFLMQRLVTSAACESVLSNRTGIDDGCAVCYAVEQLKYATVTWKLQAVIYVATGYHPGQWRCSNHWITFCWRALLSWEPALSYNLSLILLLEWENRQLEKGALRRGLHMGSGSPISPRSSGKQLNSHLRIRLSQMSWNWHISPCLVPVTFWALPLVLHKRGHWL